MADARQGAGPPIDWEAIERLPEFQELATGRRRFAWIAGGFGIGFGALYVVLAATAHDLMRTSLGGSFSLGFAWGVALILVTWAITYAYMRRSREVWAPLEARVRALALAPAPGDVATEPAPAGGRFAPAPRRAVTPREVTR
ncbi:MAG: hypothetical protein QOG11_1592 [Solirubrobacteraceae bacterium]|jgi:uncharacterized membrane protein (DUF485 family)|nr:hypothetical protein [Solirubrobacteraceae bacterium]